MFYVYILYSSSKDSYYIGQTEDLQNRLNEHNSHFFKGSETTKASDWVLYHSMECKTRKQAILIEKHIKRMKSRKYLEHLKQYPEIGIKLKAKYS